MVKLYITSRFEKAGKTMLGAGLARYWLESGKKVGYQNSQSVPEGPDANKDAIYFQKLLTAPDTDTEDKDIVIIEGTLDKITSLISQKAENKVLVVHDYNDPIQAALVEYQKIGKPLIGIIINKVPLKEIESVRNKFGIGQAMARVSVLGVIPEDRILMSPSAADLAELVQGKIVNNPENAGELVENLMLGSSTFDRGAAYYVRKSNKAVLLWGDRPGFRKAALANLQLAALQTSTRCIVISNNGAPLPAAVQKADEQKVSIISAPGTLTEVVNAVEKGFQTLKFNQDLKLPRLKELLNSNLNLQQLTSAISLPKTG